MFFEEQHAAPISKAEATAAAAATTKPKKSKKSDVVIEVLQEHEHDADVGDVDPAFVSNW
jgi:hypothetical protein